MVTRSLFPVPRNRAREIIAQFDIRAPEEIVLEDIATMRDAHVRDGDLVGYDARLVRGPKLSIITVRRNIREPGKRRFAIAHELGHHELHRATRQLDLCTGRDLVYLYSNVRPEEPEANAFAAELLMPTPLFAPRCQRVPPSFALIENLAAAFATSLTATALRYIEICDAPCAIVHSEVGAVKWCYPGADFPTGLERHQQLHPDTHAHDIFHGTTPPVGMRDVPAKAWLQAQRLKPYSTIKEESRALPHYDAAISLLWVDGDIFTVRDDEHDGADDPDHFTPDGKRWRW